MYCPIDFRIAFWMLFPRLHYRYLLWHYRFVDPELCCCGDQIGCGGSICHHGGCRSAKEYAVTCAMEEIKPLWPSITN